MTENQWRVWCSNNSCPVCNQSMEQPFGIRLGKTVENICHRCYKLRWARFPNKTKVKKGGFYNHLNKNGIKK